MRLRTVLTWSSEQALQKSNGFSEQLASEDIILLEMRDFQEHHKGTISCFSLIARWSVGYRQSFVHVKRSAGTSILSRGLKSHRAVAELSSG